MVSFTNCKINLGLRILNKRTDGYHNLDTVFIPIPWHDVLEILPTKEATTVTVTGITVSGDFKENICYKAHQLLQSQYTQLPNVAIYLHKTVPIGAGLGGGSANGAFTLVQLNQQFNLGLTNDQLLQYAAQLGSDCAFFIHNQPCHAISRGEVLTPIEINLQGYKIALVNPSIHVSTALAFKNIVPEIPAANCAQIVAQPITTWRNLLINDFEASIFANYPTIATLKENFYQQGAVYAAMSGTGSTVFGIFNAATAINFPTARVFNF
jgi:4-diphosphocytidyl-2-C-methyl-D-erythritol kinase